MTERITPRNDSFFSSLIKDPFKMNESFKTDPSLATSARAAKESGSYLCASNVTPTAVRFIVSVFLCLLCFCRMSSTQMTCSHFRKNRPKKRQKPAGCRSRIISKNRPVPIFGRSTGASLVQSQSISDRERGLWLWLYYQLVTLQSESKKLEIASYDPFKNSTF